MLLRQLMEFLCLTHIQPCLFQLLVVLEQGGKVIFYPNPYVPIIEIVIQYGHFNGDGAVQMLCGDNGNMRQAFGTLLLYFLLIHLDGGLCLFQENVIGFGHVLSIILCEGKDLPLQQVGVRGYFGTLGQMQDGNQLMVGNFTRVFHS